MKKLVLLLAMAATLNGCAHMPSWMLKAHVGGYNLLHQDKIEVQNGQTKNDNKN